MKPMVVLLCPVLAFSAGAISVHVSEEPLLTDVIPFGINISAPEAYGANQILNNIIPNPGFEPGLYGMVFHAAEGATGRRVPQAFWDPAWNNDEYDVGQPSGFWDGAEYEIVYGPAKGRQGRIERFVIEDGQSVFYLDSEGPAPAKWDVLFVRRNSPGIDRSNEYTGTARPGSPGKHSLRLVQPEGWKPAYAHYADSVWRDSDRSAGKLFVVRGNWRLEFWAKSAKAGERLQAVFKREGEAEFLNKTFELTPDWKRYDAAFNVPDGADALKPYAPDAHHSILMFAFYLPQAKAEVLVDDLVLCRPPKNPTAFTDALCNRLKELRPGVLRFWAGQLGDTLDNQLAAPFARRPHGFRPHSRVAWRYGYSLPEFLELCDEVGAEPWYVIPPTFSQNDLANLVAYLAAPASEHAYGALRAKLGREKPWTSVFDFIHLEYGNEMWGAASGGDPFTGASALGGDRYGAIANDRLGAVRKAEFFNQERFRLIAGCQTFAPATQKAIGGRCKTADTFAFAPYFGRLEEYATPEDIYAPLFSSPFFQTSAGEMRQNANILKATNPSADMAVYELNFHTTDGLAPQDVRNAFVAGASGAVALPLGMLVYQRDLGITRQCAFTNAQYSFTAPNGQNVRLWGLLRDLEATGRKRPTWLGLELVNEAVHGDLLEVSYDKALPTRPQNPINGIEEEIDAPLFQSFAFGDGAKRAVVLFNLSLTEPQDVQLELSNPPLKNAIHKWIAPAKLDDINENEERVKIQRATIDSFSRIYGLTLPPHSVHVLQWQRE